jgi:hypothetical protein
VELLGVTIAIGLDVTLDRDSSLAAPIIASLAGPRYSLRTKEKVEEYRSINKADAVTTEPEFSPASWAVREGLRR